MLASLRSCFIRLQPNVDVGLKKTTSSVGTDITVEFPNSPHIRHRLNVAASFSTMITAGVAAGQEPVPPVPKVSKEGSSLRFAFPEMRVGIAEYDEGPTGTTVFYFPKGVKGRRMFEAARREP